MKTCLCYAVALGCLTVFVGCSEETTKKMGNKAQNGNGSGAKALDDAKKKAGDAVSQAGDKASETVTKAGDKASEVAAKAGEKAGEAMDALGKEFSAATDQAKSALAGVEGGPDLLKQITDLFANAQQSVTDAKDSNTAQAASEKLGELDGKIDAISQKIKTLPEGARTAISGVIAKGIEQLNALAEKVKALPGVADVIKPKLDAFIAKLSTLKE